MKPHGISSGIRWCEKCRLRMLICKSAMNSQDGLTLFMNKCRLITQVMHGNIVGFMPIGAKIQLPCVDLYFFESGMVYTMGQLSNKI